MAERLPQDPISQKQARELAAWVAARGGTKKVEQLDLQGQHPEFGRDEAAAIAQVRESLRPRGLHLRRRSSFRAKEKTPLLEKRAVQILTGTLGLGLALTGAALFIALVVGLPVGVAGVVTTGWGAIGLLGGAALSFRATRPVGA